MKLSSLAPTLAIRPQLARSLFLGTAIVALFGSVLHAAQSTQPVQVQGVVEVINDDLRTPYTFQVYGSLKNQHIIPALHAGKRLIIEMIATNVSIPNGQTVIANYTTMGGSNINLYLPFQDRVVGSYTTNHMAIHKVRLIHDPRVQSSVRVSYLRDVFTGSMFTTTTITGYLEDLPALIPVTTTTTN